MNYTVIDTKNAEELDILSHKMLEVLKTRGGFCIIADEEDTLKGISVFTYSDRNGGIRLEYIMVTSEYRKQGIAAGMLEFAGDVLRQGNVGSIVCNVCGKIDYISDMMPFMKAAGFHITVPYDQVMEYRLKAILDNQKFRPLFTKMPDCIKPEQELLSSAEKRFFSEVANKGLVIESRDYDHGLSRFYVKDGDVAGCMLVTREDELVNMRLFCVTENGKDPIAFPGMLAACARAAYEQDKTDRVFRLHFRNTGFKDSLNTVLGYPEYDYILQKYEKTLQD